MGWVQTDENKDVSEDEEVSSVAKLSIRLSNDNDTTSSRLPTQFKKPLPSSIMLITAMPPI